jgi:hypothetical protein
VRFQHGVAHRVSRSSSCLADKCFVRHQFRSLHERIKNSIAKRSTEDRTTPNAQGILKGTGGVVVFFHCELALAT